MKSQEIRQQFINFFKSKAHTHVMQSPVVLANDPTLLFVNAGMNQFKDVFLGTGTRDYTRAVNSQPCIRVSGKHNDLEEVGLDTHHLTSFEMLGNWSFGDYYKKEAIAWAWELFTNIYALPKAALYATVYETDDEAIALWKTVTDIDPEHILKFGKKENFWEMAETGPCGPCSEIHIDRGVHTCNKSQEPGHICQVNGDCARFIELWNLVFIQYNRQTDGTLEELPRKHVDTGAGLERLAAYLQNTTSSYETDLLSPIIDKIVALTQIPYTDTLEGMPHRVMADHIRTLSFAIADNVVPSNEGRGYVLRRILRRALRYAKKLNIHEPILYKLVDPLVDIMGPFFTHLTNRKTFIQNLVKAEEESFLRTLESGIQVFDQIAIQLKATGAIQLSGADAFKLYDTFGFPIDLTEIMAKEQGLSIDFPGFQHELEKQRALSRQHIKLHHADDERASRGGEARIAQSDDERLALARHHTATHLLQAALRAQVGEHVHQAGSLVDIDYLRFDFSNFKALSDAEIQILESKVNAEIQKNIPVKIYQTTLAEAKAKGALALFGEKYNEEAVRVVQMDDFSIELCGGNHVQHTGQIEAIKILSESAISAGTRRIVAIAGKSNIARYIEEQKNKELIALTTKLSQIKSLIDLISHFENQHAFIQTLSLQTLEPLPSDTQAILCQKNQSAIDAMKQLERQFQHLKDEAAQADVSNWMTDIISLSPQISLLIKHKPNQDIDILKTIADTIANTAKTTIVILSSEKDGKGFFVVKVPAEIVKTAHLSAGDLIKRLTAVAGGGGGGRAEFAQAGGADPQKIALATTELTVFLTKIFECPAS